MYEPIPNVWYTQPWIYVEKYEKQHQQHQQKQHNTSKIEARDVLQTSYLTRFYIKKKYISLNMYTNC